METKRARTELPGEASASSSVPAEKPPVILKRRKTVHFESDQHTEPVMDSSMMDKLMSESWMKLRSGVEKLLFSVQNGILILMKMSFQNYDPSVIAIDQQIEMSA